MRQAQADVPCRHIPHDQVGAARRAGEYPCIIVAEAQRKHRAPSNRRISCAFATSQRIIVPPVSPDKASVPSAEKATALIGAVCASKRAISCRVATSSKE